MQVFWWVVREPALFHPALHGEMQVYRYSMVVDLGESVRRCRSRGRGRYSPRLSATTGKLPGRRVSGQPLGRASVKLTHQPEGEPAGFGGCVSRTETGGRFDGINTHRSARQPGNNPTRVWKGCPPLKSTTLRRAVATTNQQERQTPIGVTHSLRQGESQSSKGDETHSYSHSPVDEAARVKRSGRCIRRLVILSGSIARLIVENDRRLLAAQAWNNGEVPPPPSQETVEEQR